MKEIMLFQPLYIIAIWYIMCYNSHLTLSSIITKKYFNCNNNIYTFMIAGLGNRLMSFAGIIILSIYFDRKPKSILVNI